jgi:hypothetical protein
MKTFMSEPPVVSTQDMKLNVYALSGGARRPRAKTV